MHLIIVAALITANFKKVDKAKTLMEHLKSVQPSAPFFAVEFWSGWFDHWGEVHNTMEVKGQIGCCLLSIDLHLTVKEANIHIVSYLIIMLYNTPQ